MSKNAKNTTKKEYAPSFGFWPAKSGNGFTTAITEQLLETLAKAKVGGRLLLSEVPEDVREENDRIPTYRVTIFEPGEKKQSGASDSL